MGYSSPGLHLGTIHSQQDALGWEQGPLSVKLGGQASNAGQQLCARFQTPDYRSGQEISILPKFVQSESPHPP